MKDLSRVIYPGLQACIGREAEEYGALVRDMRVDFCQKTDQRYPVARLSLGERVAVIEIGPLVDSGRIDYESIHPAVRDAVQNLVGAPQHRVFRETALSELSIG